jgi:hypothetical protein
VKHFVTRVTVTAITHLHFYRRVRIDRSTTSSHLDRSVTQSLTPHNYTARTAYTGLDVTSAHRSPDGDVASITSIWSELVQFSDIICNVCCHCTNKNVGHACSRVSTIVKFGHASNRCVLQCIQRAIRRAPFRQRGSEETRWSSTSQREGCQCCRCVHH